MNTHFHKSAISFERFNVEMVKQNLKALGYPKCTAKHSHYFNKNDEIDIFGLDPFVVGEATLYLKDRHKVRI